MISDTGRWISLVALVMLTAFCGGCTSRDDNTQAQATPARPVKLHTVGADIAGDTRQFPAVLKASEEADLAFRVGGQLAVLDVMAGQQVKKGELLARLDATDYRLQVELREANHRLAKSQFQRLKVMLPQGGATQSQFDEAKATLDQAANALQQAKNQLAYTHLYAPYDGVISSVSTENYQYVNATQPLMHLQNNQVLDVEFQVPENLIARLYRVNYQYQPKVLIDVIPGRIYNSHYREHTTTPDSYTKAYDVSLTLERPEQDDVVLLPGMTATVEIDLRELLQQNRQALLVPVEAVFLEENTPATASVSHVWVFDPEAGKVALRQVQVGELRGDQIEVLEGLAPGEQIVAAGVNHLSIDMAVRPWVRERGI